MMKKIICLVLGLLMMVSILTSCSSDGDVIDDINNKASRLTTTLNLWVITESEVVASVSDLAIKGLDPAKDEDELSDEEKAQLSALSGEQKETLTQLLQIRQAINKITKQKLKTQINVKYVTEAEYYTKVEKAFVDHEAAIEAAKEAARAEREAIKRGEIVATEEEEVTTDETVINEYGIPELKYPTADDYQVDILFIGNYDKYREYVDKEWLVSLNDKLENSAMQISYFVNQIFLESSTYSSLKYAVPNNHTVGDYTYLCINTDEMEALGFTADKFDSLSIYDESFYQFLKLVKTKCDSTETAAEKIYPIYSESGTLDLSLVHYWNFDLDSDQGYSVLNQNKFSIFGGIFSNVADSTTGALTDRGDQVTFSNLLKSDSGSGYSDYLENYLARRLEYEKDGYITTDANATAMTCVVKGGWELKAEYEAKGYDVYIMENPRATDSDVYSSMFALGAYTSDENRAMEIITYLNTNSELRNLLQYGVENVNYTLSSVTQKNEEGIDESYYYAVETENNTYKMDINKTGNVFLAYPSCAEDVFEWEYGKQQNLDATTYPTLGLYFNLTEYQLDEKSVRIMNAVSERLYDGVISKFQTKEDVFAFAASVPSGNNVTSLDMAKFLLEQTGNVMTYKEGCAEKQFTEAELAAAIVCMETNKIASDDNALQSPNALYVDWLTNSGVRG